MLFIHPMWDSENQRLGLKACTTLGYSLRSAADLLGFIGLFLLIITPFFLLYQIIAHHFLWQLCWLLGIPLAFGILGRVLFEVSWMVAAKKQFHYDCNTRTVKWIEG